jgi:hypothetical protein
MARVSTGRRSMRISVFVVFYWDVLRSNTGEARGEALE